MFKMLNAHTHRTVNLESIYGLIILVLLYLQPWRPARIPWKFIKFPCRNWAQSWLPIIGQLSLDIKPLPCYNDLAISLPWDNKWCSYLACFTPQKTAAIFLEAFSPPIKHKSHLYVANSTVLWLSQHISLFCFSVTQTLSSSWKWSRLGTSNIFCLSSWHHHLLTWHLVTLYFFLATWQMMLSGPFQC